MSLQTESTWVYFPAAWKGTQRLLALVVGYWVIFFALVAFTIFTYPDPDVPDAFGPSFERLVSEMNVFQRCFVKTGRELFELKPTGVCASDSHESVLMSAYCTVLSFLLRATALYVFFSLAGLLCLYNITFHHVIPNPGLGAVFLAVVVAGLYTFLLYPPIYCTKPASSSGSNDRSASRPSQQN